MCEKVVNLDLYEREFRNFARQASYNFRRTVITAWILPRASELRTDVTVEPVYQEIDLAGTVCPTIRTLSAELC